ncbi:MAG: thiamine phosphate synthase [Deltaproteobacteria bacterium]|nr:thiamine phosphate synthase [Deltaproteobacteria bacterium]
MRIIAITAGGPGLEEKVHAALAAGAEVLVRETTLPVGIPYDRVVLHARMPGALDQAWALHLSSDMDVADWRRAFDGRLSASAHSVEEAHRKLALGADDVILSPIFEARHGREPIGTSGLHGLIALGGVAPPRLVTCRDAGAVGVAVLGGIWQARDGVTAAVARYRQKAQMSSS